eukprot:gb/GEZN01023708.1/.p1 GENE.gb/GEZN01023708.1/~~gb/GEZN01023708.1/.p1  ORF type:complete len:163 (+),score=20.22 gb/GEZN01023708.1/:83-571(+)
MKTGPHGEGTQTYCFQTKQQVDDSGRVFYREEMLSARQYIKLLTQVDQSRHAIKKYRRTFVWRQQHFILDDFLEPLAAKGKLVLQLQRAVYESPDAKVPAGLKTPMRSKTVSFSEGDKSSEEEGLPAGVTIPPFCQFVRDVTEDEFFSTYYMPLERAKSSIS